MIGEPSDAAYRQAGRLILRALERIARDEAEATANASEEVAVDRDSDDRPQQP